MIERRPVFPGVIEINHQAGYRIGCNVYLVYDGLDWALIDIGYEESVDEIIELVRQLDFPLAQCRALVATHADVDHIQGLAKAKAILKAPVLAHPLAVESLESGDKVKTFAEIAAQNVHLEMPVVKVDREIRDGDLIEIGRQRLEVWHTPGHTDSQLAFGLGNLLLSGDNIYRDGSVGAIDAHHGSDIPAFIRSLERIAASDVEWLLPSHGPIFRKDDDLLARTLARLRGYLKLADFGTCAPDWPLIEEWDRELAEGRLPGAAPTKAGAKAQTAGKP
ncbi:MAG: MBL fold metallo-hydrolase [Pirellulales bacterium]|jgi:glyoxylase-like metal-dependent hydrolase (beta-lactamase superfamily II)